MKKLTEWWHADCAMYACLCEDKEDRMTHGECVMAFLTFVALFAILGITQHITGEI